MALVLAAILLATLPGCTASRRAEMPPASAGFSVPAGAYRQAFQAARQALLDRQYELDRVDAAAGIIRTRPRQTPGLLAPWTLDAGARVVQDTLNAQSRCVEVRFESAEAQATLPSGRPMPLAQPILPPGPARASQVVHVSVRVFVLRRERPTRRLETAAIGASTNPTDPALFRRGLGTVSVVPVDVDASASAALARAIEDRLGQALGGRDADGGAADQRRPGSHPKLAVQ